MSSAPIIIAQVGCGYWGPNLLRTLSSSNRFSVKWLVELDKARQSYAAANFPRTQLTDSLQQVLADTETRAVAIVTPAASHYEMVKQCLNAGKDVFCEKPLSLSMADAEELVSLARAKRLVLMTGHTFLYHPAVHYIKNLLEKNELGTLYYIYSQRLNLGQLRKDVNVWWNLAPHDLSILQYWLNGEMPQEISVRGSSFLQENIEDVAFANLSWSNGTIANIQVSWLDPQKTRRFVLVGSRKMVIWDDGAEDRVRVLDKGFDKVPAIGTQMDFDHPNLYKFAARSKDTIIPSISSEEPLKNEMARFAEYIETRKVPELEGLVASQVVLLLEEGQNSMRSGNVIRLGKKGRKVA